jgi:hypothetical protein
LTKINRFIITGDNMVWIKFRNKFLNSENIEYFDIKEPSSNNSMNVSIVCSFNSEYGIELWSDEVKRKIISRPGEHGEPFEQAIITANEIIGTILNGLETAKKNGDSTFDLDELLKSYPISN